MRTYWLIGEDPTKTRRNSTESDETAEVDVILRNNNNFPSEVKEMTISDSKEVLIETSSSPEDEAVMEKGLHYPYQPTTWLLSEYIDLKSNPNEAKVII